MRKESRILLILAGLLLLPVFKLPLWSIRIVAPQYNDGLGMFIGLRDIWGHTQHDIQNINILNHYIGMRPIVPAEVDVLTIMPFVVAGLIVAALLCAAIGRRFLVAAWLVAFAVLGSAGLYEFYSWNYEYGHNLSPDAPIKVPGMVYTPPIIGTKTLLTIHASSWPWTGTLLIGLSFLLGAAALVYARRPLGPDLRRIGRALTGAARWLVTDDTRRTETAPPAAAVGSAESTASAPAGRAESAAGLVTRVGRAFAGRTALVVALAGVTGAAGALAACGGPRTADAAAAAEFAPGGPPCDYCDGVIPEERFGGELVTAGGEVYRFMSVECLAAFVAAGRVPAASIASLRVVDYNHGEKLIDARTARFVRSQHRPSPNGLNLLAAETEKVAHNLHFFWGGERLDWDGVVAHVRASWEL
jgi:copper chaperone NosL